MEYRAPKIGIGLGRAWLPVFQLTQVIGIISGVSPLRSVVNIGGGFKDLVAIPISEYKKMVDYGEVYKRVLFHLPRLRGMKY